MSLLPIEMDDISLMVADHSDDLSSTAQMCAKAAKAALRIAKYAEFPPIDITDDGTRHIAAGDDQRIEWIRSAHPEPGKKRAGPRVQFWQRMKDGDMLRSLRVWLPHNIEPDVCEPSTMTEISKFLTSLALLCQKEAEPNHMTWLNPTIAALCGNPSALSGDFWAPTPWHRAHFDRNIEALLDYENTSYIRKCVPSMLFISTSISTEEDEGMELHDLRLNQVKFPIVQIDPVSALRAISEFQKLKDLNP